MPLQVIGCEVVPQLLAKLTQQARVMAPQPREGRHQWSYAEVREPCEIDLSYITTTLPPKKFAFPPVEKLVEYRLAGKPIMEAVIEAEPLVIFGAHPCDIYALRALDIALCDNQPDPNYLARREKLQIVGVDCEPDEYCFCGSMGTASVTEGYDLFLTPLASGEYLAETATEAGEAMLAGLPSRAATATELAEVRERLAEKIRKTSPVEAEAYKLPLLLTGVAESAVWEQQAERCYSCGTCNLVCPTCYCFDVIDRMELTLDRGAREREWDACMLESFAKVATGESFRETRDERLRHRFYRKYSYLFTKYGRPYCCGCGRCARQCLVHINPVEVLNALIAEAEGRRG